MIKSNLIKYYRKTGVFKPQITFINVVTIDANLLIPLLLFIIQLKRYKS